MSKSNYLKDPENLEVTRVRLENAEQQPTISKLLAEYGYGAKKIAEGAAIRAKAEEAYNFKKIEDLESSEAHNKFKALQKKIDEIYSIDRKKGKTVFAKNKDILKRLGVNGSVPESYVKWYETVETYYRACLNDEAILQPQEILKVTSEHCTVVLNMIAEMKLLRTEYLREKGESQEATSIKDNAFSALDDWMREFKSVAKIALIDHPQLLEALKIKP
ncbi:MAG: hypothetical protein P1P88_01495 [Bacteroidales bacterium]|nr:hypothetical protein [Bacteroidales bacterium]